jgi:hypothetical protein
LTDEPSLSTTLVPVARGVLLVEAAMEAAAEEAMEVTEEATAAAVEETAMAAAVGATDEVDMEVIATAPLLAVIATSTLCLLCSHRTFIRNLGHLSRST